VKIVVFSADSELKGALPLTLHFNPYI